MDRMTDLYMILEELISIMHTIDAIVVEGFDEEYGFSDRSIQVMERVEKRITEVVKEMKET